MPRELVLKPDQVARVHARLKELFRKAGKGSISATEKALGLRDKWIQYNRRQSVMDLGTLLAILEHLEIDPMDFLRRTLGDDGDSQRLIAVGGKPKAKASPGRAAPRSRRKASAPLAPVDRVWLEQMDSERYDDAEGTLRALWSRADDVPSELVPLYLGVCASCHRSIGNISYARECLEIARRHQSVGQRMLGDLLIRLAYVESSEGAYLLAIGLARQATEVFERANYGAGQARALISWAFVHILLQEVRKAALLLERARPLLDPADSRHVFSLAQLEANVARMSGDLPDALKAMREAEKCCPDSQALAALFAMKAELHRETGDFAAAAEAFKREIVLVASPLDALLATVELVDVLARQQKTAETVDAAKGARAYAGALKGNRLAEAALVQLYREACSGTVRSQVVRALKGALSKTSPKKVRPDCLAAWLQSSRRILGLSCAEVASETGVPENTLRKIESMGTPGDVHRATLLAWLDTRRPERRLARM